MADAAESLRMLDNRQVEISPETAKDRSMKIRKVFDQIQDKKSVLLLIKEKYKRVGNGQYFKSSYTEFFL